MSCDTEKPSRMPRRVSLENFTGVSSPALLFGAFFEDMAGHSFGSLGAGGAGLGGAGSADGVLG